MIKVMIQCNYCGIKDLVRLNNLKVELKYFKCKHCNYDKFKYKEIKSVDYYNDIKEEIKDESNEPNDWYIWD